MKKPEVGEIYKWIPLDIEKNPSNEYYEFKVLSIENDDTYRVEYLTKYPYAKIGTFTWPRLEDYWVPIDKISNKSRFQQILEKAI